MILEDLRQLALDDAYCTVFLHIDNLLIQNRGCQSLMFTWHVAHCSIPVALPFPAMGAVEQSIQAGADIFPRKSEGSVVLSCQ